MEKKGTDLGLLIAKSLMTKMDGNLSAELIGDQLKMKYEWKKGTIITKIPSI
ncbi:hypothetical protein ACFVWC_24735 [Bacillus mycoides]|uniref:hypothetical protein n=1 Tax=Bacillus TaxID=1386 RepID=UPI000303518D|nr:MULTISPECIES: hypothetical protein [Bacillus]MBK5431548.1 hypothetical protein [Bacillus sp. TH25]